MESIRIKRINTRLLEMQSAVLKHETVENALLVDVWMAGGGSTIGFYLEALEFSTCRGILSRNKVVVLLFKGGMILHSFLEKDLTY